MLDSTYWDKIAETNQVKHYPSNSEIYTQNGAVNALLTGIKNLPRIYGHIRVLKTDLWSEGVQRNREVLMTGMVEAKGWDIEPYGIDISPIIVNRAKKFLPNVQCSSITTLPFENELFDLILDCSTIDHIPFHDATQKAIKEYYRCLTKLGILVLQFSHIGGTLDKREKEDYYCFNIKDMRYELEKNKLKVIKQYSCHHLNTWPLAIFSLIGMYDIFNKIEYTPISRYLYRFAPMYTIIARKE